MTLIGLNHLGVQVETPCELRVIADRLKNADFGVYDQGETTCCYAKSDKAWVADPSGIHWEAYQTMADAEVYGPQLPENNTTATPVEVNSSCCVPDTTKTDCC